MPVQAGPGAADAGEETALKCRPILVDGSLRELTQHGTPDFPLSMDRQAVSDPSHGGVLHWHREVQIALVTAGEVLFETEEASFRLKAGEGFFVGGGVLHQAAPAERAGGVYICVNFLPDLLCGPGDGVLRRDYVDPLLCCERLRSFPLTDQPWHREVCALLAQMGQVEEEGAYGCELHLLALLCRIWQLLAVHHRQELEEYSPVSFGDRQKMRNLRTYIHKHYMERLTLAEIAAAGHISRGECCRVFRRVLNETPMGYLTRCRLEQGERLVVSTDLSIAEIARQVGFHSASYFTELFRRERGITPLRCRREHRTSKLSES